MSDTVDQLTIHLLGAPEARIAGTSLALHHQKARALLYYLAATGQSHTRDYLASLLWSETLESNARHSLRSSLYHIRQALHDHGSYPSRQRRFASEPSQLANDAGASTASQSGKLQGVLSQSGGTTGEDAGGELIVNGDLVHFRLNHEGCDVTYFRRLLTEGSEKALTEALTLYRGPFLQGFTVTDAPLFEEWQRFEEHELAQAYLTALQRLTAWAEERQDWNQAISYAQHIVQLEPLAEETQQRLIRLYLHSGAIGQALRQYHQFETELRHELGLTPLPETRAMLSAALATRQRPPTQRRGLSGAPINSLAPIASAERVLIPSALGEIYSERHTSQVLPFVGRDEVLKKLFTISQEAGASRGSAVLIQGEDGIGRSRLMDELAALLLASQPPWLILQGFCSPFDDLLSYGPFLEAFQNADLGDLAALPSEAREADEGEQQRFLWSILQALRMLTHNAPLLLTIDDLQWANSPTLHLFCFLATRLHNLPVLLVGAVQRAEAIPALQRLVTLGRRHGDIHVLSLPPLAIEDVRTLTSNLGIDSSSDIWVATTFSEWLHERASGSPFILAEIIAQLQAEGILTSYGEGLRLDMGRWRRWRATFTLPETTHDLVAWRLTNLSPDARALLDVLAVANLPLPYKLLREFPGILGTKPSPPHHPPDGVALSVAATASQSAAMQGESDQLLTAIEGLEARGLVIEMGNEQLALAHNLLRETLLHSLSQLRRQDIHRQLARIIEQCPALQQHFPVRQVALHAVAGEDSERARHYALQILDELVQDNANAQTATFLRHLYDLLAPTAAPHEMLRLSSALGRVHQSLGQLEEAASWHRQHLELAGKIADLPAMAAAHFELGELALVANDYQAAALAARSVLALELPAEHMALIAGGHRLLGAALAMEGSDLSSAEHHLQEAVAAHRLTDTTSDLCATLFELGNVAAQRGELKHALELYQEAARTAEIAHVHYFLALAQNNFAYHSLLFGRLEDARQALTTGKKLAERHELFGALMHLSSTQGEIHLYLGEWQASTEAFHSSLTQAEELRNLDRQAGNRAGLALAERGQGNLEVALTLLEEALNLLTERGYWHLRTRIQLWLAEILLLDRESGGLLGNFDKAELHLKAALATARTQNRTLLLLHGERLDAYLLAARGDWPGANVLFSQALERASSLHLSLEAARIKAIWGQALLRYAPLPHDGQRLLSEAQQAFISHDARAELRAIESAVRA